MVKQSPLEAIIYAHSSAWATVLNGWPKHDFSGKTSAQKENVVNYALFGWRNVDDMVLKAKKSIQ